MPIRVLLWVLLTGLYSTEAVAQQKYHVSLIDTEAGLPQSTVYAIIKDTQGFVWFGTAQSLSRFDGRQAKNYDSRYIIPQNNLVSAIVEDKNTDLWICVGSYLVKFDRQKERFIPVKVYTKAGLDFLKGRPVAIKGTTVWCFSPETKEIFSYDYRTHKKVVFLTKVPFLIDNNHFLNGSFYDQRSSLWLHLTEGVLRFDINTSQTQYFFSRRLPNVAGQPTAFHSMSFQRDSVILANNSQAIALPTNGGQYNLIKKLRIFNAIPNSIVMLPHAHYDFVRDFDDGLIWIRRDFGVFKLNPLLPKFQKITQSTHGTFNNEASVRSLVSLNDSIVRVATSHFNYWYNRRSKTIAKAPQGHALSNVIGRLVATKGGYWIATAHRGLAFYDIQKNTIAYFPNTDTLNPDNKFANVLFKVVETDPNTLLVSSESGLYVFRKKTHTYHRIPYFGTRMGRYPFKDRTGRLYISNENLHVGRLRDTVWLPEKILPQSHRFRNGFEDTLRHVIWGATTEGAKMINPRDWSVRSWTTKDGLNDHYIYDLLVDKQGRVWMSTNRGISRLDLKTKKIDNFKLSDGLQSLEYNSNTAHIAPDGEFFLGGVRGFNHFYPDQIQLNKKLLVPILTDVKIGGQAVKLQMQTGKSTKLRLEATQSSFSLDYSAIDYFSNGQNTFQYRLKGLDNAWIQANQHTTAQFVQVPAGKYTFEVKAANSDGIWNPMPATLTIEIAPQIWETIGFRVAMLLLLLAGMYGFYRYRLYLIQQQQRKEMAVMVKTQEAERMRFAQDLHDGLGSNLTAIKMVVGLLDDPASQPIKAKTESLLKESIDDLRHLIHAMSPRSLARLGLAKAVQELAIVLIQTGRVQIEIQAENFPKNLPDEMQVNLYRIVQELFQNALKHAQAAHITLKLEGKPQSLMLHYTDDGCGFDSSLTTAPGNGLSNLHIRTQLLNGTLEIQSVVGTGTTVEVEVPF